ncbi:Ger(x)C family spore germination C-terminal domain-containing protein [Bacillaceae bacterium C204]|uniref:Ger(x)C family spore germination C-terminal domain-containing protein n=1 Tax=Neobacillus sp. 204 TaxID=3383351 RepID=UPI00397B3B11
MHSLLFIGRVNELSGTAVFKKDKLRGFLDGNDTKYFLFALNQSKGRIAHSKRKIRRL